MGWNMHHHSKSSPQGWLQLSSHPWLAKRPILVTFQAGFHQWRATYIPVYDWNDIHGNSLWMWMSTILFFHLPVGRIVSASCSCIQKWWSVSTSEPRKSDPSHWCWLIRMDSKAMADFRIPVNKASTKWFNSWPFDSLVGGHQQPLKGSRELTIPERSQIIARYNLLYSQTTRVLFTAHVAIYHSPKKQFKNTVA